MRASCQFPCRYRHRITTQAIFQKRKRPAFPRIIAEFASLMEVTTRFELVNEGFADLCLTTWPRHHMSRNCFLLFFWSGRRGSNSLPPPWQGGALPDELRPHIRGTGVILVLLKGGASDRNRTNDTGIFSPLLYRLSYRGKYDPDRARTDDPQRDRLVL